MPAAQALPQNAPLLQATQLSKAFRLQGETLPVIAGVSFGVRAGEFVCLVGPSGSGKSTLLRLVAGLLPPDSGQIWLAGQPLSQPNSQMVVVFQKANLMPWRTVLDNVQLPLHVQKRPPAEAQRRASEALALVGLSEFSASYPHELSGGMQQRVAIARALVADPQILLLDEPFGALDALTRERLNQELLRLWQVSQKTVLMVTHDIQEAVLLADRVLVLSQRPATLAAEIPITLSRPRPTELMYHPDFTALARTVRQAMS